MLWTDQRIEDQIELLLFHKELVELKECDNYN